MDSKSQEQCLETICIRDSEYVQESNKEIKQQQRYRCEIVEGLCKPENCSEYLKCSKKAKKEREAWDKAFEKRKEDVMKSLRKGEV